MIRRYSFNVISTEARDELVNIDARAGALVVVDGLLPQDLSITPVQTPGGVTDQRDLLVAVGSSPGASFFTSFASLRIRHGVPSSNGIQRDGTFNLYVCEGGDTYKPGMPGTQNFIATGDGPARIVPQRTFTTVLPYDVALNGVAGTTTLLSVAAGGDSVRVLGYRCQVPATHTRGVAGDVKHTLALSTGSTLGIWRFAADATARAGVICDTGVVMLGNGFLVNPGQSVDFTNSDASVVATSAALTLFTATE